MTNLTPPPQRHTHILGHLHTGQAVLLGVSWRGGEHPRQRCAVGKRDRGPVSVVDVDDADLALYRPLDPRPVPVVVDELGGDLVICDGGQRRSALWTEVERGRWMWKGWVVRDVSGRLEGWWRGKWRRRHGVC